MVTLAFPTLSRVPSNFTFGTQSNTLEFTSPLSSTVQTIEMPSPRWSFSFSMENMEEADTALLQVFFAQLRGRAGRFTLHNFARPSARGTNNGTPLIDGASQTGTSVNSKGWAVNEIVLLKGDFINIGSELKIVTADVTSNSNGDATIFFEFPIRTSPADSTSIVTDNATALFMLTEDKSEWTTRPKHFSDFNIQGIEVL